MKKALMVLLVVALLVVSIMAMPALAKGDKVDVCHVNSSNGIWYSPYFEVDVQFGRVISVAPDAVEAHYAHGDGLVTYTADGNPNLFRNAGDAVGNGNCGFAVE